MRRVLPLVVIGILAVLPSRAQKPDDISIPEFRQTLIDYFSSVRVKGGADLATMLQSVPDSMLEGWYGGVPNGRAFQRAVQRLKARQDAARIARPDYTRMTPVAGRPGAPASPLSMAPESLPAAGIASTPVPSIAPFSTVYPSGPDWSLMVGALQGAALLPAGDVSNKNCTADDKSALTITVSTFKGIKSAADSICEIIPDILIVIAGFGTEVPAKSICYAANLIVTGVSTVTEGLLSDCETQNALTSQAENEAGYRNTIILNNLKFRLKVEQNLQSTISPIGLFEVPTAQGGYLENVRAIVADIIAKSAANGVNVALANASILQGDAYYNSRAYKLAYGRYKLAYSQTVQ
jgi:hypothetical protein